MSLSETTKIAEERSGFAAIFVDLENLYYELKHLAPDREGIDYILSIIRTMRSRLTASPIIVKAYADFERLDSSPQGSLYLMGVETHNVMGTEHKNAADMRLCIDVLEVLYTRPEIQTFVLIAGDRDYIPLVQHLRRQGRHVLVSSFRSNLSGDLLQNIEKGNFFDALELLTEEERREIDISRSRVEAQNPGGLRSQRKISWQTVPSNGTINGGFVPETIPARHTAVIPAPAPDVSVTAELARETLKTVSSGGQPAMLADEPVRETAVEMRPVTEEMTKRALTIMLNHFGKHAEVWMTPLLWKLSNEMPLLADFERKTLIANMQVAGAIRIVRRKGDTHDYAAVVINYNHPSVRECMP